MAATRSEEEVLHEIERDLRADERVWRQVDRDLTVLGVHAERRTGMIVVGVIVVLALLAGAFALGWNLAPAPAAQRAVVTVTQPFTSSGLWAKRDAFLARYGTISEEHAVVPPVVIMPASSLASKLMGFEARYGAAQTPLPPSPPSPNRLGAFAAKYPGLQARLGAYLGVV